MPVLLSATGQNISSNAYDFWCALEDEPIALDKARRMPKTGQLLEAAFDAGAEDYLALGKRLGAAPSGDLAHAPACAVNPSDLGLMLAWSRVIKAWAADTETILIVCPDPWMYRHLATSPGVSKVGKAPAILKHAVRLWFRGYLSRLRFSFRAARGAILFRPHRRQIKTGEAVVLAYAHPASTRDGMDGFFGDLLIRLPRLRRLFHTDRALAEVRNLTGNGRSLSLHAWGKPFNAFTLPFVRWRPSRIVRREADGWLIRRAAVKEGSGGTAAAIRWQQHCQKNWLRTAKPACVTWPWENHNWERAFVRQARALGVRTVGYQHTVVGHQMLNHAIGSNPDNLDSIPDHVICNGPQTLEQLLNWGVPKERLVIGGALRFPQAQKVSHDPGAPFFVALPFDTPTARQMVDAVIHYHDPARQFLIKAHPIYGFDFTETDNVKRAGGPLTEQTAVAGVIYAATTVGLELY